jgi:hypothetical protein
MITDNDLIHGSKKVDDNATFLDPELEEMNP